MTDPTNNNEILIMPPEDVEKMLATAKEVRLDVSGIRRKFPDRPYGADPKQAVDIYLPNDGDGPFPIVFFVHGGSWAHGQKDDEQVVPFIGGVDRGYAVVSIGYRLIPDVRYPDNLFDIKAALRWAARNAEEFRLDPARAALCGDSAGAHLAMMAAFTQGIAVFGDVPREPTCSVRAVVEQYGPTDFAKIHEHYDESGFPRAFVPGVPSAVDVMLGVPAESITNLLRFYNPIDNVHPGIPPVLLQHGKRDPLIPYQQALDMYDKIIEIAGEGRAELDISEEFMHADPGYASPESVERIYGFIDKFV